MLHTSTAGQPIWTADFDFALPPELIAQTPIEPRDASRLLVVNRGTGSIEHALFRDIGRYLRPGDLLVLNDSRVLAARLHGQRLPTGGKVEALLIHERAPDSWEAMLRHGKRIAEGQALRFTNGSENLEACVERWLDDGLCLLAFPPGSRPEAFGTVPLPPYIYTELQDPERYQTVYARESGSAAAPTAGLHFTPDLLAALNENGIETAFVTLHVGPGTFRPVHVDDARDHPMHAEYFRLSAETAAAISRARREGRRIIAVGTTSVRVLEQIGAEMNGAETGPCEGWTRLLILPGYRYRVVDGLATNFHLPRSTLLMLLAAFMGRDLMFRAYHEAIDQRYRFYSFGDAMLVF